MSSDSIPLGLIGVNFGRYIIRDQLLKGPGQPYFHLAAICDANPSRLKEIEPILSGGFNGKLCNDLDEILRDPNIPVVGLFTGPVGRADLIRKIIRAGKDVITTKPFELDPEAALSVLEEARSLGRYVLLNSPGPVPSPDVQTLLDWQKKYNLGQAVAARTDVTASYHEKANGGWYDDPKLCPVAPIFRLGIYLLNDLWPFFPDPERVHVLHSRIHTERPTPDNAQLGIRYRNGALANVFASFCVHDGDWYRNSLVLNFERGTAYRNVGSAKKPGSHLSLVMTDESNQRQLVEEVLIPEGSGGYPWAIFHQILSGNAPANLTPPEHIVTAIRIIRAMSEAELGNGWADVR